MGFDFKKIKHYAKLFSKNVSSTKNWMKQAHNLFFHFNSQLCRMQLILTFVNLKVQGLIEHCALWYTEVLCLL